MTLKERVINIGKAIYAAGARVGHALYAAGAAVGHALYVAGAAVGRALYVAAAATAGFMKRNWKGTLSVLVTAGVALAVFMNPAALTLIAESVLFGVKPFAFLGGIESAGLAITTVAGMTFAGCMALITLVAACTGIDRIMNPPTRGKVRGGGYNFEPIPTEGEGKGFTRGSPYSSTQLTKKVEDKEQEEERKKRKDQKEPAHYKSPIDTVDTKSKTNGSGSESSDEEEKREGTTIQYT